MIRILYFARLREQLDSPGEELELTPEIRKFVFGPAPLIITKSSILSRVHRRAHMDYVGLKLYGADGKQVLLTFEIITTMASSGTLRIIAKPL